MILDFKYSDYRIQPLQGYSPLEVQAAYMILDFKYSIGLFLQFFTGTNLKITTGVKINITLVVLQHTNYCYYNPAVGGH